MAYAIVDAPGCFGSAGKRKSWVHEVHHDRDSAVRAARKWHGQVIRCDLQKGDVVYDDAVGRIFPVVDDDA